MLDHLIFDLYPIALVLNYVLTIITIVVVIKMNDTLQNKIGNVIIVIFLPLIGNIYYWLSRWIKQNRK